MKRFISVALMLVALSGLTFGAMTYDQSYYRQNRGYLGSATSNDPLYNLWGTLEGLYEGTEEFDAIRLMESTGATYYTKIQAGNQSANLTLTLPTAYATTGYVLSSTDAGVLSWVANGGTFTGGNIASDVVLNADGVDILADTTTAHTFAIQGYADAAAYKDILRWTNGATVAAVLGASDVSFSLASTGMDISSAGAVSNVTTLAMTGALSGATTGNFSGAVTMDSLALPNGASIANSTDTEIAFTEAGEDLVLDMDSGTNIVGLKSSTGVTAVALGDVDTISGIEALTFDADAATAYITMATDGAAEDLTVRVTGATDSSLVLSSSGQGADALQITTSAGGIDITSAGTAGEDIDITASAASINISATEAVANQVTIAAAGTVAGNAIAVSTTNGGISIAAAGSANGDLTVTTADDASITATDDFTINGGSTGSILNLFTNAHANVLNIGTGTAGNTINVATNDTTADTITIGSAKDDFDVAGEDITLTTADDVTIISSSTGGLVKIADNAVAQLVSIGNETGASSLTFKAGTGNIAIDGVAATTITIGDAAQTGTVKLGESSATMQLDIGTGTGVHTVHLADGAAANVVTIANGAAANTLTMGSTNTTSSTTIQSGTGDLALTSTDDITLTTNTTTTDNITITNTPGTATNAISIQATAGGIDIDAAALKDVTIGGGQVAITGVDNAAGAISLLTNTGTSETITITNTVGTSVTEGAEAIGLRAVAGGIGLRSTANLANAIQITSDGGTTGSILVYNDQGTAQSAIKLMTDAGGMQLVNVAVPDGQYGVEVSGAIAGATASEGVAAYFHSTISGNVDGKVYNIGSWLDITAGTPADGGGTEAIFSAADLGLYGAAAGAELADAKLRLLNLEYQVDADCAPVEESTFIHFNCLDTEDTPDYLFTFGNAASAVYTANATHTAAATDKIGAIKIKIGGVTEGGYIYVYSHAGQ